MNKQSQQVREIKRLLRSKRSEYRYLLARKNMAGNFEFEANKQGRLEKIALITEILSWIKEIETLKDE